MKHPKGSTGTSMTKQRLKKPAKMYVPTEKLLCISKSIGKCTHCNSKYFIGDKVWKLIKTGGFIHFLCIDEYNRSA